MKSSNSSLKFLNFVYLRLIRDVIRPRWILLETNSISVRCCGGPKFVPDGCYGRQTSYKKHTFLFRNLILGKISRRILSFSFGSLGKKSPVNRLMIRVKLFQNSYSDSCILSNFEYFESMIMRYIHKLYFTRFTRKSHIFNLKASTNIFGIKLYIELNSINNLL
jgi:hypothetical protein